MTERTLLKVFRVFAKYKKDTIKGGSGYDLLSSREEIFREFDAWKNLVKPKILHIKCHLETLSYINGIPYWELEVIYQISSEERYENLEDIIRRIKELVDWNIVTKECKEKLTTIFTDFLEHGSMDKLRQQWLFYAEKYKQKETVKNGKEET